MRSHIQIQAMETKISNLPILKIIIKKDLQYEIFEELQEMNIDSSTLFPGLDGFAESLYRNVWKTEAIIRMFK